MEFKLLQRNACLCTFVVMLHAEFANGSSQCPKKPASSNVNKCPDRNLDRCPDRNLDRPSEKRLDQCGDILTMLAGMDKANKGLQLETRNQIIELDNKMTNILHKIDPCSSSPCVNGKCSKFDDGFKCTCDAGFNGKTCNDKVTASDCYEIKEKDHNSGDGVHMVKLWQSKTNLEVYCDMSTDRGGWTVFQNRFNGDVDFYRSFRDYEQGFGDVYEEFWLGLKHIEELASQGMSELRLDLTSADGNIWSETYSGFKLTPQPDYHFHLTGGINASGNSSFHMMLYNGFAFTTWDQDSDLDTLNDLDTSNDLGTQRDLNCGLLDHSGWWYGFCTANHFANLNGEYCKPGTVSIYNSGYGGMIYRDFKDLECLKASRMMIRRNPTIR